jgi:hypothetical protein
MQSKTWTNIVSFVVGWNLLLLAAWIAARRCYNCTNRVSRRRRPEVTHRLIQNPLTSRRQLASAPHTLLLLQLALHKSCVYQWSEGRLFFESIELCAARGLYFLNCFPTRKERIRVAIWQRFELQSIYTPSCKYWVLPPDAILPLQLQPDSGSSCNWYTLLVTNTKCFRLIRYYPFVCNRTVVRVAINAQSELQILSASIPLQLQLDSSSSCNRCTLRVANTEFFTSCNHCIIGSCNRCIFRVVIGKLSLLQLAF